MTYMENNINEILERNGLDANNIADLKIATMGPTAAPTSECRVLETVARLRDEVAQLLEPINPSRAFPGETNARIVAEKVRQLQSERADEARAKLADIGAILAEVLR